MIRFIIVTIAVMLFVGCDGALDEYDHKIHISKIFDIYDSEVVDNEDIFYVKTTEKYKELVLTLISCDYTECWSDLTDYDGDDIYLTIGCK